MILGFVPMSAISFSGKLDCIRNIMLIHHSHFIHSFNHTCRKLGPNTLWLLKIYILALKINPVASKPYHVATYLLTGSQNLGPLETRCQVFCSYGFNIVEWTDFNFSYYYLDGLSMERDIELAAVR